MKDKEKLTEDELYAIVRQLSDNRSKLSALFSLYNTALLTAEDDRSVLGEYYDKMIDLKNDLNLISNDIGQSKKTEKAEKISKNKSKIKRLKGDVDEVNENFSVSTKRYKIALQECGSLKTEYKHKVSELCKEFKAGIDSSTAPEIIKGYKQQVRVIKAILDRIEQLVCDYNVKRNKIEEDNARFAQLYASVNMMLDQLQNIA